MQRFTCSVRVGLSVLVALGLLLAVTLVVLAAPPVKGAIFTTGSNCAVVNQNSYPDKDAVYLNGGPAKPGAAGLPDGSYYVRITEPNGKALGTSVGSANETPIHVTGGEFDQCYQLAPLLVRASDGTMGYDDTGNAGGVYKVWVSNQADFANNSAKTDNFHIKPGSISGPQ